MFGKFLAIVISNILSPPSFLLLPIFSLYVCYYYYFFLNCPTVLECSVTFFYSFGLCILLWKDVTDLSSSSVTLSSAMPGLLMRLSEAFFIFVSVFDF